MADNIPLRTFGVAMPRRARPLDPQRNPVHRLAQELREVHRRAGKPTRAWLGSRMNCSHATVSHILNGDRFPSWQLTSALITAC
ncbi:helix-turn-helix domain-containing protein, partial [Acrocarpospora corrugata]